MTNPPGVSETVGRRQVRDNGIPKVGGFSSNERIEAEEGAELPRLVGIAVVKEGMEGTEDTLCTDRTPCWVFCWVFCWVCMDWDCMNWVF